MRKPISFKKFKNFFGFSTPELLMTLVVFSFGLLPLIVLFQSSHKTTAQAKNLMIAQSLGRTIIDEVRSLGFEGVQSEVENPKLDLFHTFKPVTGALVPLDTEPDSINFPEYYGRFQSELKAIPDDTNNTSRYRIELEIKWREPNREFNLGFGTVLVRYGAK